MLKNLGKFAGYFDRDFAWKIRWRMRHDRNPLFSLLADKLKVKEFAAERGVEAAKVWYVTDTPETIPFDHLPLNCFIKANHGSGWNIIRLNGDFYRFGNGKKLSGSDGSLIDERLAESFRLSREECIGLCRNWLNRRWARCEWGYQDISPKIFVEEILFAQNGKELMDYRLYTFQGVVKAINVGSPSLRRNQENIFFDPNWNEIELTEYREKVPDSIPVKPDSLSEMIRIAETLGKGMDFLRIDLYNSLDGVRLGEITLYPERGQRDTPTSCRRFNRWLGEQWALDGERAH